MGRAPALIAIAVALFACGDERTLVPDAPVSADALDAPIDADFINFPFTGRFLDWDSTASTPCPIADATWTVTHDHSRVATTAADGTFTVPITTYYTLLDVAPPATASTCTDPGSPYTLPGIAVAPPAVVHAGGDFVARSLTTARVTTFYVAVGQPFDATRANVLIHFDGPARAASISSPHAAAQAFDGTAWTAGTSGADVFFPNIDLTDAKRTTVVVAGGAIGTGSVPLAAGSITYMTVITK